MSHKSPEKPEEDSPSADPIVEDQVVEVDTDTKFVLVQTASQRGRSKLVDSNGYTYVVMREAGNGATHWRCSKRNKVVSCRAMVMQQGPHHFTQRGSEHCHPPDPGAQTLIDVAEISAPASSNIFNTESALNVKSRTKSARGVKHLKNSRDSDSEVGDEITPERTKPQKKKKRGRKSLGLDPTQLKKRKREQAKRFNKGRVRIGVEQHERWARIKEALGVKTDRSVAKFLMDRYESSLEEPASPGNCTRKEKNRVPGTSDVPPPDSPGGSTEDSSDEEWAVKGHSPSRSPNEYRPVVEDFGRILQALEST